MNAENPLLRRVYSLTDQDETERVYDEWAKKYDADLVDDLGYVGPRVTADRLAALVPAAERATLVVLDAGCGTGLVGAALAGHGFTTIDGADLSAGMLDTARGKGVYRDLAKADLTARLPYADATYDAVTCVGTLTEGHVGPQALAELVRVTRPGGLVLVPILNRIWEANGYRAYVDELVERGSAELVELTEQPSVLAENAMSQLVVLRAARS